MEFTNIEREILISLLNKCHKTALVLHSNEAESYARLLTSKRVSAGKESYFQEYFGIRVSGLVTPLFISRLARIKESGIVEWLTNVTEYISLVEFHAIAKGNTFANEEGPAGASLEGNIVVVFSLLMAGVIMAIVGFILEVLFPHAASQAKYFMILLNTINPFALKS